MFLVCQEPKIFTRDAVYKFYLVCLFGVRGDPYSLIFPILPNFDLLSFGVLRHFLTTISTNLSVKLLLVYFGFDDFVLGHFRILFF